MLSPEIGIINMFIVALLLAAISVSCQLTKNHTVIGVYTQSLDSYQSVLPVRMRDSYVRSNRSMIPASFVEFIEMSGARVIPLFAFSDQSYFDQILPKINGVLFAGGNTDVNIQDKWTRNSEYVMKFAMNETKRGNPFPIWGSCQGMQQMVYLTSGYDSNSIGSIQGSKHVLNTLQIQPNSTLFQDFPQYLLKSLEQGQGVMYFNHHLAVTREYYTKSSLLQSFWDVQAYTTVTTTNQSFISVIKAKEYPFYGIQFHPEKVQFEWKVKVDRSQNAVEISQMLSNRFVEIARKNTNKLSGNEELIRLSILNYQRHKSYLTYHEVYYFDQLTSPNVFRLHSKSHLLRH